MENQESINQQSPTEGMGRFPRLSDRLGLLRNFLASSLLSPFQRVLDKIRVCFLNLPIRAKVLVGMGVAVLVLVMFFLPQIALQVQKITQIPHIIAVFPASESIEVETTAVVEITFDIDMNRESVEGAFQIQPQADGNFTWNNNQSLIFRPQQKLEKNITYTVQINQNAKGRNGKNLGEDFVFSFTTLGDPKVIFASPLDTSNLDTLITVMFDRPMVSLTTTDQNEQRENILGIEPPLNGVGKWMGTSAYVFRPSQLLNPSSKYTVKIDKDIVSPQGDIFREDYSFSFITQRPAVDYLSYQRYSSYDKEDYFSRIYNYEKTIEDLGPRQKWMITFTQDMNRQSVEERFDLFEKDAGGEVAVNFSWDSDKEFIFEPIQDLNPLTVYHAQLNSGALGKLGNYGSEAELGWDFKTADLPGLVFTTPNDKQTLWGQDNYERGSFKLTFKSPMNSGEIEELIKVNPLPESDFNVSGWGRKATLYFWQKASTEYTITIPQTVKDLYGRSLPQTYTIQFSTAPLPKTIGLISSNLVNKYIAIQNADVVPRVAAKVTNVEKIDYELYELTNAQVVALINERTSTSERSTIWQSVDLTQYSKIHTWSQSFGMTPDVPFNVVSEITKEGELFLPGIYFLEARVDGGAHDNLILVLSKTGLLLKVSPEQVFTWATSFNTAEPVSDMEIEVVTIGNELLTKAETNADGVMRENVVWPKTSSGYDDKKFVAIGRKQDDVSLVTWEFNNGIANYDFSVYSSSYDSCESREVFLTFDRPLYRPGQEVFFKGYLRLEKDVVYAMPPAGAEVEVVASQGYKFLGEEEIFRQTLLVDGYGSFTGSISLADDLPMGEYYLKVKYGEDVFRRPFRVEEYRKPDYQVVIETDRDKYLVGDTAKVSLSASYFGGGAVANAPVTYEVSKRGGYYSWPQDIGYYFNQARYLSYPYSGYSSSFVDAEEGQGRTGSQGEFDLSFSLVKDSEKDEGWNLLEYVVAMGVQDVNNQTAGNEADFRMYAGERLVGIKPHEYYGYKNLESKFDLVVLNVNEQRIAGQKVNWEVYERVWTYVKELGDDGQYYTKSEPVDTLTEQGQIVSGTSGEGSFSFIPQKAGYYIVKAKTKDAQGRQWESSLTHWVSADDETISFKKADHDRIDLVMEKSEYQAGERASIFAPLPFEDAKGLVTIERLNVLDYHLVDLPRNSQDFTVEIKENYVPNVFVSLTAVKPGNSILNPPDFKIGLTKLLVDIKPRELELAIETNKERYRPQETVEYSISAMDADGQPVEADFSLAVVDKAVLSLSNVNLGDILQKFYFERDLQVQNTHSLIASLEKLIVRAGLGAKGGSGSAGFDDSRRDTSRKNFLDTVIFEANLRTNKEGRAEGKFELPDNLTTFNLLLVGSDAETRVGSAAKDILVAEDLYIRPILPRFGVWGDEVYVGAVIQNQTDFGQQVNASVSAEGFEFVEKNTLRTVSIEPNASARLYWPAKISRGTEAKITYQADSLSGLTDGLELTLPLKRPSSVETTSAGGHTKTSITETVEVFAGEEDDLAEGAAGLAELSINVSASLLNQLEGGMDYALGFSYDCVEQIVTKMLAALLNQSLNEKLGTNVLTETYYADSIISTSLQKLYTSQRVDGGWSYWPGDNASNAYLSAYVLQGLHEVQESGANIDRQVYESAKEYSLTQLKSELNSVRVRAYLLYVDSLVNEGSVSYARNLYGRYIVQPTLFTASSRIYLYLAMENLAGHSLHNRQVLESSKGRVFNDLTGLVRRTANTARWEEEFSYETLSSTTKSSALMIQALLANSIKHPLIEPALNYLLEIKKDGYWSTTQNTISVLMSLADYIDAMETEKTDFTYSVKVGGGSVLEGNFDLKRILEQDTVMVSVAHLVQDDQLPVALKKTGAGTLYYHLNLQKHTPLDLIEPKDEGMVVERVYFNQDGSEVQEINAGETITTRVTLLVPENRHHVVLEDYFPAGFDPINVSFATEHISNQDTFEKLRENADYRQPVWYSSREMRDDRVLVFVTYLSKGIYEFTYKMRATTPGKFSALPSRAYELYQPDVFGSSSAVMFTINP
ncbi:Ig-like domain-containing protein [Patescibacteria group bacterium]|nr:Ig-like domain-containing protein [Patescibacteria group bacterium]